MAWLMHVLTISAHAEGSAQLGGDQAVQADTDLFVDVIDPAAEAITWSGGGPVDVFDPSDALVATLDDGDSYAPVVAGAHRLALSGDESTWDVAVTGAAPGYGRVWSAVWNLNAGDFAQSVAFDESVFALVDGGGAGRDGVVELAADGFAGNVYTLQANQAGIPGANGRSVLGRAGAPAEYPIYLNPPERAAYNALAPVVASWTFAGDGAGCEWVVPGVLAGAFQFDANVEGTYHVVCDLDADGTFDITSDEDLHLLGATVVGVNAVPWDGTDNVGDPVPAGAYACQVTITVGEFHYVGEDIETSFPGFGLFAVDAALGRTGLPLYWNDAEVQADETSTMPDGEISLVSSGALGVPTGGYGDLREANVNARSWGEFASQSKGNDNTLDTYTWLAAAISTTVTLTVEDAAADADLDALPSWQEACEIGTDPLDADTDDDGLDDAEEGPLGTDPLAGDTDADGLLDGTEVGRAVAGPDTDPLVFVADADAGATTTDPLGADTDGDGLLDGEEDANHDGASPATIGGTGSVGAGETDPSAADTDGDGLSDLDEGALGTSPVDTDTDDDALLDPIERDVTATDPLVADTDGDRLLDGEEVDLGTDPLVADTDGGGVDDGTEVLDNGTDPLEAADDVPPITTTPGTTDSPPPDEEVSGRYYGGATCAQAPTGAPSGALALLLLWRRRRAH